MVCNGSFRRDCCISPLKDQSNTRSPVWMPDGGGPMASSLLQHNLGTGFRILRFFSGLFHDPLPPFPVKWLSYEAKFRGSQSSEDFLHFSAQFLHPTLSRPWPGTAQRNVHLLFAIPLLPRDTEWVQEWVGKHCWCIKTVYCSSDFLMFGDNFNLCILFLAAFDIWELNIQHCPISFSLPFPPNVITKESRGPNMEGLLDLGWGQGGQQPSVREESNSALRKILPNFLNLMGLVMGTIFSRSSTLPTYFNVGKLCPFPSANVWCIPALLRACLSILGDLEWRRASSQILSVFFRKNDIPKLFHFLTGSGALPKMIKVRESITVPKLQHFFRSSEFDMVSNKYEILFNKFE